MATATMKIQKPSTREEAQNLIYRGCARLMKAMQVKRISPSAAQRWEDEALREAREILSVVLKCRLKPRLVIPPLPIALLEVHHRSNSPRPLRPSDIHSPLEQTSTSWWTHFIASEDYPEIPSDVSLGDPSTFWWEEVEERDAAHGVVDENSRDEGASSLPIKKVAPGHDILRRFPRPYQTAKRLLQDEDELDGDSGRIDSRASKRCRKISRIDLYDSDEEAGGYIYVPRCESCEERGDPCHVIQQGDPCVSCRARKCRCSAYQGSNRAIKGGLTSVHRKNKLIFKDQIKVDDRPHLGAPEPNHPPSQLGAYASTSKPCFYPAVPINIDPPTSRLERQNPGKRPEVACYDIDMPTNLRNIVSTRPTKDITKTAVCGANPSNRERVERPAATQHDLGNREQAEHTATSQYDIEMMGTHLRTTVVQPPLRHDPPDATGVSIGPAAPAPKRVLFDKTVSTENRRSDDSEVDFKNILASVILETVELRQRRTARATLCTNGPQSTAVRTGSTTGERADGDVEFMKELMSLVLDVVQLRSQRSK